MPREAVQQRIDYIKALYQRTDKEAEQRYIKRPDLYLSQVEMDRFVEEATQQLDRIYRHLWEEGNDTSDYLTTLELPIIAGAQC
jgi:hypothetical protein